MLNYDFIISKIKAIHSKSYFGENFVQLKKISSIDRLYKELFNTDLNNLQIKSLYTLTETMFKKKIYDDISKISKYFGHKNRVINSFILKYEIENVKLIINYYYNGKKEIKNLFEIYLDNTINYDLVYSLNISDLKNITKILNKTVFQFLIPHIEKKEPLFLIENLLDKFYYNNFFESLEESETNTRNYLKNILIYEADWQNIVWAFRTKVHYGKEFAEIKNSFIVGEGLLSIDKIEKIFDLQFVPNEAERLFENYPKKYKEIILKVFRDDGDADIPLLEKIIDEKINQKYIKYFYIGENILPVIAFVYLKIQEYYNIVSIVESLRYT
ncbi:MAG TPA: V-type ATPase subunit [Spirochaetota bacterium]|nr:V-type ATPase subunit [Spirochaetota bacterium]